MTEPILLSSLFLIALLYASVGHAGASGYIAVMTLAGMTTETIRPAALILNVLVAVVGSFQWWRAGHFSWALLWPFAVLALPAAFAGGWIQLPARQLSVLLGVVLWLSAIRLFLHPGERDRCRHPTKAVALASGAGIGFLSGLTGTGGGIFLTPLLLFSGWARLREAAAASSVFILVNSSAGLAGYMSSGRGLPHGLAPLAAAVLAGGALGATLGSRHLPAGVIAGLLALVLLIAGGKLIFG